MIPYVQPFQNPPTPINQQLCINLGVWIGWLEGFAGEAMGIPYGQPFQTPSEHQTNNSERAGDLIMWVLAPFGFKLKA